MTNELVKADPISTLAITDGRMSPTTFDQLWRLSEIVAISGMAPKSMTKPEQLVVAAAMGMEVGLSYMQSIQGIAVINGRPSLWGDHMLGLIMASNTVEGFVETFKGDYPKDDFTAVCVAKRKGGLEYCNEFSVAEAKEAGLWGKPGPWQQYKRRMLKMRARAFTLRDGWSDVLKGLYMAEEMIGADAIGMHPSGGRYVQAEEPKRIERPVYEVKHAAPEHATADHLPDAGKLMTRDDADGQTTAIRAEKAQAEPSTWRVGDMAFYRLGMGIGWKQVRIMGLSGDTATIEFAEDYEHAGKQMRGVVTQKPVTDLRREIPQALTRDEFINMRKGFTTEYMESIRERIEETKDAKVIADLIFKAKKFFGDDYKIPGLPPADDDGPEDEEPPEYPDDLDGIAEEPGPEHEQEREQGHPPSLERIGDDPERKAIKHINALINERGMDKAGIKLAMKRFVLHLKGESPIHPFDVESTKDIHPEHVKYFDGMLAEIQPQHNILMSINDMEKRVKGIGQYIRQKMLEWPSPVEVAHWYLLPPNAVNKIKLNLDDWAKELLSIQEAASEKF